jgi:hypothetical protein
MASSNSSWAWGTGPTNPAGMVIHRGEPRWPVLVAGEDMHQLARVAEAGALSGPGKQGHGQFLSGILTNWTARSLYAGDKKREAQRTEEWRGLLRDRSAVLGLATALGFALNYSMYCNRALARVHCWGVIRVQKTRDETGSKQPRRPRASPGRANARIGGKRDVMAGGPGNRRSGSLSMRTEPAQRGRTFVLALLRRPSWSAARTSITAVRGHHRPTWSRSRPPGCVRQPGGRLGGLSGGSGQVGGDDVGGVPVQGCPGAVVSHGGPGVSVRCGFLHIAERHSGVQTGREQCSNPAECPSFGNGRRRISPR